MEFTKINVNPKQWKHEGDCVIRAITSATGKTWEEVYKDLTTIGLKKCRMPNSQKVYEAYLEELEFVKCKMPRKKNGLRYTIEDWIIERPNFTGVITVANHMTYVEKGVLIDTWNCSGKSINNYWVK